MNINFLANQMFWFVWIIIIKMYECTHTEYEDMGLYPQKEHSLVKPYQGIIYYHLFNTNNNLICLKALV